MTLVDTWTKEELEQIAQQCTSMRSFAVMLGYKSTSCFNTIRNRCDELGISVGAGLTIFALYELIQYGLAIPTGGASLVLPAQN